MEKGRKEGKGERKWEAKAANRKAGERTGNRKVRILVTEFRKKSMTTVYTYLSSCVTGNREPIPPAVSDK